MHDGQSEVSYNFPANLEIGPLDPLRLRSSPYSAAAQRESIERYGIAGRVWEAAYAVSFYVENPLNLEFHPYFGLPECERRPLTILELGSGTGMVAEKIAGTLDKSRNDLIIATDLPEVCPLLMANLQSAHECRENRPASDHILVKPLAWGNAEHAMTLACQLACMSTEENPRHLTHIVCSDLVYFPELHAPLLRTIIQLTSSPFIFLQSGSPTSHLTVTLSYKIRSLAKETPFWSAFGLWFTFEPVLVKSKSSNSSWQRFGPSTEQATFLFVAHRRGESFDWHIPETDQDLLDGVGAWGTDARKGDDTFETLLLMGLGDGLDDEE